MKHTPIMKHCMIPVVIAGLVASSIAAEPSVLFTDDFKTASSETLNSDGWFFYGEAGSTPWRVEADNTAPLSENAMVNPQSSSRWTFALKQFPATALHNVGDSLTVSLSYHASAPITDGWIGISLLNSAQIISSDSTSGCSLPDAVGYTFRQHLEGQPTAGAFLYTTGGSGVLGNDTIGDTGPNSIGDGKAHTLSLTISKVASGVKMTWSVDGQDAGSATSASGDTFNTVRLFAAGQDPVFVDNIRLVRNVIGSANPVGSQNTKP